MAEAWPLSGATLDLFGSAAGVDPDKALDLRASPGLAPDLAGTPPTLIVMAGFDPLRDQGLAFAARLEEAGIPTISRCEDSLPHSFTMMGGVSKEAQRATERIASDAAKLLADA